MTNQTPVTSNQLSLPLAFNFSDETKQSAIKRPVFEIPGSSKLTFKGRIIEKLTYHHAHHNRLRALFFTIIDALIRRVLRTKEDVERSKVWGAV